MYCTEEEAKAKVCRVSPGAMVPGRSGLAGEQPINYAFGKCMGSACMQWRWAGFSDEPPNGLGYCGLAGQPMGAYVRPPQKD